jgi:single-stranded DNA-binding protein
VTSKLTGLTSTNACGQLGIVFGSTNTLLAKTNGNCTTKLRVQIAAGLRSTGEVWVDKSNYFTVEVYGARARVCAEHPAKGSRVVVEAELDWREWTDQENSRHEAVVFRARQILFEGARPSGSDADEGGDNEGSSPSDAEPAWAVTPGDGSAGAEDLPF